MRAVLGELPNDQRRVVELAYFGGFTHEQIAEMLNTPLGTVKAGCAWRSRSCVPASNHGRRCCDRRDRASKFSVSLAAYALGALPEEERARLRGISPLPQCRAELEWLRSAVDVLPASVPQVEPPPS